MVSSFHEPAPKLYGLGKVLYEAGPSEAVQQVAMASFTVLRGDLLKDALCNRSAYIETSPQVTFLAPAIKTLYPQARFIHLVRKPGEVVRSAMRRQWYQGNRADQTRIVPRKGSAFAISWEQWSPLQKNYWLWAETNRWIAFFMEDLPQGSGVRMMSSALFSGDPGSLAQLYESLNRPVPSYRNIDRVLRQKLNAQETGHFKMAKDLPRALGDDLYDFVNEVGKQLHLSALTEE